MTTTSSSIIKLTDAQLVALSAASQRPDLCIVPPRHMRGGAVPKFAGSLIAKGVAEEIGADAGMPILRRDGGRTFALVITAAGLAALGLEPFEAVVASPADGPGDVPERDGDDGSSGDRAPLGAPTDPHPATRSSRGASSPMPREGTKIARVIAMLEHSEGAAIGELTAATGWLAHTMRAALTGLRKRGYTVELEKGADGGESRYRMTAMPRAA